MEVPDDASRARSRHHSHRHARGLPARRGRRGASSGRRERPRRRGPRRHRGQGGGADPPGARDHQSGTDGELPGRVRPLHQGGRGADVPRRGAAQGARRGDHRRADRGQDRAVRLGQASRPLRLAAGQRLDLGADADRQGPGRARGPDGRAARRRQAARRAGDPHRRRAGHARAGPQLRARPHHRGGAGERGALRGEGLHLFLRHAGRGGADRGRRAALPPGLFRRDHRPGGELYLRRHPREPGDLGQALGPARALRVRPARPRDGRADGADPLAGAAGQVGEHGLQHRRRGGRPARPLARRHRGRALGPLAQRLGRLRRGRAGLWAPGRPRHRLALRSGDPPRPQDHGAPGEGRLLGHRDQARAGDGPEGLSGLHPQGLDRRQLHRQRREAAGHDRPDLPAVRHPQRPYRERGAGDGRLQGQGQQGRLRVPAPARHGRDPACRRARGGEHPLPHLRPGRRPPGPAGLSGAASPGERRQLLLRQPDRRREHRAGGDRPGSLRRRGGPGGRDRQSGHPPAGRSLRRRPGQRQGLGHHRPRGGRGARRRPRALPRPHLAGRADDRRAGRRRDPAQSREPRPARRAGRPGYRGERGGCGDRACRRAARLRRLVCAPRRRAGRRAAQGRRSLRGPCAGVLRPGRPRGGQVAAGRRGRSARGGRLPALLRG